MSRARLTIPLLAAPRLFLHLKQWVEEEKKAEPFFFNTHPRLVERIGSTRSVSPRRYSFI
jgi:hypothetical protein